MKSLIASIIDVDMDKTELEKLIIPASRPGFGDYALPCFKLAGILKKSPKAIAEELVARTVLPPELVKAEAVNGYLNFFVDRRALGERTVREICRLGAEYGSSDVGAGKTICIDYSSVNIAKPFHVGHLLATALGGCLYKAYKKLGYRCVGINHLGDWGTQFGKLIVAFRKWSDRAALKRSGMTELSDIYVRYHAELEKHPELDDEARMWFKRIEDGDPEATELFELFKKITLDGVSGIYARLHAKFDSYAGESFYNDKTSAVVEELREKGLLEESDGAMLVNLEKYGMPPCLILKKDGATLYATRDLAAALYRKKEYDFHKCLYVVAYQQNLHFRQVFKVLELMGKPWAKDLEHVAFGMVSIENEGAMSTREGHVVLLEDALNRATQKSAETIREKSPGLADADAVAEQVGVGAVIFSTLYNNRIKDIVFSYDKVLNFDGETAPYVQYTNARCLSVLEKVGGFDAESADFSALADPESDATTARLAEFGVALGDVVAKNEPCYLARYLVELCKSYNRFYLAHRISDAPDGARNARAMLTYATHCVISEGLRILGIDAPAKM